MSLFFLNPMDVQLMDIYLLTSHLKVLKLASQNFNWWHANINATFHIDSVEKGFWRYLDIQTPPTIVYLKWNYYWVRSILQDSREAPLLALHISIYFWSSLSPINHEKLVKNPRAAVWVQEKRPWIPTSEIIQVAANCYRYLLFSLTNREFIYYA